MQRSVGPLGVVVRGIRGKHIAKVPLAEDQQPVGQLGSHRQHEAFGVAVRSRAPGRDLDHLDPRIGQRGVEGVRELSGAVADEESKPREVFVEVWVPRTRSRHATCRYS